MSAAPLSRSYFHFRLSSILKANTDEYESASLSNFFLILQFVRQAVCSEIAGHGCLGSSDGSTDRENNEESSSGGDEQDSSFFSGGRDHDADGKVSMNYCGDLQHDEGPTMLKTLFGFGAR